MSENAVGFHYDLQSEEVDEDDSEQENSSVHSSSVRSDSSGRVKKNKRGRPAKKKKKGL